MLRLKAWHAVGILVMFALLQGCVAVNPQSASGLETIDKANHKFIAKQWPYRLRLAVKNRKQSMYVLEPAGAVGKTIASNSPGVMEDIYHAIKQRCGFEKSALRSIRIVSHQYPQFYEVWEFYDPLSKMHNKTSALTVILKVGPDDKSTDIILNGVCHAKPMQLIVNN